MNDFQNSDTRMTATMGATPDEFEHADHEAEVRRQYFYPVVDSPSNVSIRLRLRQDETSEYGEFTNFSTSNYLGLGQRPEVVEAAKQALDRYGLGSNSSPVLTGQFEIHKRLTDRLREMLGCEEALLFSSGVAANIGAMPSLVGPEDAVVLDDYAHGSLQFGAKASGADVRRYRHMDLEELEWLLDRYSKTSRRVLLAIVGVFSMTGEVEELPKVLDLAHKYGAMTLLDDAHALGVLGPGGLGSLEHHGMPNSAVDVHMGTMSKTLAGVGGYVAGSSSVISELRSKAKTHILSASIPPSVAAGCFESLNILVKEGNELASRLRDNAEFFRSKLRELGVDARGSGTAIVPVFLDDDAMIGRVMQACMERGVYCNPVVFPGVPKGQGRLRFTVTAVHERADLERAAHMVRAAIESQL